MPNKKLTACNLKYIIVGDSGVGKSSILSRFGYNQFNPIYDVTIGVEFGSRIIKIDDIAVKIQIWDTAGQEAYRSITRSYYRDATVALIVYDSTNMRSFLNIEQWLEDVKRLSQAKLIMLIGNKIDKKYKKIVDTERAAELAKKYNLIFFEVSAKSGESIDTIFTSSADIIYDQIKNNEITENNHTIRLTYQETIDESPWCC